MSRATPSSREALLGRLGALVDPGGLILETSAMVSYLADRRGLYRAKALCVARPSTTAQVAAIVAMCAEAGIAIVPQGGNTGLVGGSVPDDSGTAIVLQLGRMNRIRAVDPLNDTMTVEAGCILADLQVAADAHDRLFPLSLGAEGTCQIGGNLSTNAGGIAVLRYGNARELVLGLEVVLPSGEIWDGLRALRKDNTGYDLKQLFIGAEGTLGIITAAVLKLFPKPRASLTLFAGLSRLEGALDLLSRLKSVSGNAVTSFELIPRMGLDFARRHMPDAVDPLAEPHALYILAELASGVAGDGLRQAVEAALGEAMDDQVIGDATIAESDAQAARLWRIREAMVEAQRFEGGSIKHDVSVPVSAVPEFIKTASTAVEQAMPGIRPLGFGHIGDGNIHFNLTQPRGMDEAAFLGHWAEMNRIVHDIVGRLGGSISAEHGLGQLKREEIRRYKSPIELDLMKKLKQVLDPKGIMNPGKVL